MSIIDPNAIFMQESPFTKEQVQTYNSLSFYDVDINTSFNSSVNIAEQKVKQNFPDNIPESVQTALYYFRKAQYEYYLTESKARQKAPSVLVVGPANYRGNFDKAHNMRGKAFEKIDVAKDYLRKAIKRELNEIDKTKTQEKSDITIGDILQISWTSGNRSYTSKATIVKINTRTIVITLNENVSAYPTGFKMTIPITCTNKNNWINLSRESKTINAKDNRKELYESLKDKFKVGDKVYNKSYKFEGTVIKINKVSMVIKGEPTYNGDKGLRKVPISEECNVKIEA